VFGKDVERAPDEKQGQAYEQIYLIVCGVDFVYIDMLFIIDSSYKCPKKVNPKASILSQSSSDSCKAKLESKSGSTTTKTSVSRERF
jgi:hypothetical protein